jgi:hypothetical protein
MLADDACPTCALAKSSLAALAPAVAAEWHPAKNAIKPDEITAFSLTLTASRAAPVQP